MTEHAVSPDLAILLPGVCLVIYTLLFFIYLGWWRRGAVSRGDIRFSYFRVFQGAPPPERHQLLSRHAANLLEMPLLFYVLLLVLYVSDHVTNMTLGLAWAYVLFRAIHAFIHLGSNNVLHRFQVFAMSVLVLLILAGDLAWHIYRQAY